MLGRALVAPRTRIIYVPTPKIACTSIKWALAEQEGSPRKRSRYDTSGEQTRELTIHEHSVNGLASLASLSHRDRRSILDDPTWVRFCVVRDPYERLVSGWVDQVLFGRLQGAARSPRRGRDAPWEADSFDVGSMFRTTVRSLTTEAAGLLADRHFRPQCEILEPDRFPYSHVVDVATLADFNRELVASDPARRGLRFERRNLGIRFAADALYDRATARVVDELYVDDFAQFGFPHRCFPESVAPVELSRNEAAMIQMIRMRNERIADVSAVARGERRPPSRFEDLTRRARRRLARLVNRDR